MTIACDILLRGGTLIDGTGRPRRLDDIAIRGDRIIGLGRLEDHVAPCEVELSGLIVAPGFVDAHTHDDAILIEAPDMEAKISQGVTTVIAGNCGIGAAPYTRADSPPHLLRLVFKSAGSMAPTLSQYLDRVAAARPATNVAFLTGHTTLRAEVMGGDLGRPATPAERAEMRALLHQTLEQGSLGLSTGLFYPPARAAPTDEIIDVGASLPAFDGIYVTHLRDEADGIVESIEEAIGISRALDVPLVLSHHKCMGRRNFGRSVETLALLDAAAQQQEIAWDVYPYEAGSSILDAELARLSSRTVLSWCDPHPEFSGMDLESAASALGCDVDTAITRLQPAGAIYFMMDETDVERIMASPRAMVGSDGLPGDQHPHPRLWGTFPKVLGAYARDRQLFSLETAVHRMTGLSARTFKLYGRGIIRAGNFADLCVFDAATIADRATYQHPERPSAGIEHVIVNGTFAFRDGRMTGERAGAVLRGNDFRGDGGA